MQAIQFPKADNFYSIRTILTVSGRLFLRFLNSLSVVLLGTSNPFLFPGIREMVTCGSSANNSGSSDGALDDWNERSEFRLEDTVEIV